MKVFKFKTQQKKGNLGEKLFINCYHKRLAVKSGAKEFDIYVDGNKKVEIKTDFYSMSESDNFFIERWSNWQSKKPGSVWQAYHNAEYFVYLFIKYTQSKKG